MFGTLLKRKIDTERLSNVFVNAMMEISESGYNDISELILDDPAFVKHPNLKENAQDLFLLVLIAGNLRYIDNHFEAVESSEIKELIQKKFSVIFDMPQGDFNRLIADFDSFISRVNHPSKNTLYGMSKAIFHKFELNDFQEDYFKNMRTPNPLFLKRLDEVMNNFIWDWEAFFKRHKLQPV